MLYFFPLKALEIFFLKIFLKSEQKLIILIENQENAVKHWEYKIPWRRKWQPTPVFLPREPHGQKGLGVYDPWGYNLATTPQQP